jgi:alpha-1,3-rhamnosyl/mannosyltransferase
VVRLDLGDRLVLTGFAGDEALGGWYSAADLVAFPSRYEGFGLPLLEAMACGAPVLASSAAALPEVGGDAAAYVDPDDEAGWAEALRTLLQDTGTRDRMRRAGLERAAGFSWDDTARQTWDVYREVAR